MDPAYRAALDRGAASAIDAITSKARDLNRLDPAEAIDQLAIALVRGGASREEFAATLAALAVQSVNRTGSVPPAPTELVEALRQAGGAVEEGRSWYRALGPDGSLWCETSNPREAADSVAGKEGYTLERLPTYIVRTPWERWKPEPGR